ncbi:MAG: hypothetical protein JNL82_31265 [Myxococcales bacterium]|nr:hypothetical protein [Myxococcales bacterium]
MRVRLTTVCLFSGLWWLGACGGGDTPALAASTSAAETTAAETPTSGEASGEASTGGAEPDTTSTGEDDADLEFARGIRLTRVTATQAVQTELVIDGVEVPAADYPVRLISRRKTVLRAEWSLHADFVPRELIGRLTIWTPEGADDVFEFKVMVDGPSNDGDLFKTFSWQLPPEAVRPGLEYRIEVLEPDPALASGEVSDPPPILPLAGRGALAVDDDPMEIKVRLIPVRHEFGGDVCMPAITDADIDDMRVWMEMHNPVERAILEVGEPMTYTASIGTSEEGFVPILGELGARRAADEPPDNLYYYGLLDSCDGYPPGLLGTAIAIPDAPTPAYAFQRVATGRWRGSGVGARDTFVHEVGHSQGRYHIACSGGEAGTDDAYPHSNGRIGRWGYGIHDTQLRSPTAFRDYMSYCDRSFVSDFGWRLTYDFIKELSSWDARSMQGAEARPLLVGVIGAAGSARWYTTTGAVPPRQDAVVEFTVGGSTIAAPAAYAPIPDADGHMVAARLPAGWADVTELRVRVDGAVRARAPRASVRELHAR